MSETEVKAKDTVVETVADDKKQDWDKERQRADQEKANAEKARADADQLATERDEYASLVNEQAQRVEQLEKQLEAKAKLEGIKDVDNLDPALVDPAVIKAITRLKTQLESTTTELTDLRAKANQYEQIERQRENEKRVDTAKERILKPLDEEYGAKYRNEAMKLAQDFCDKRKRPFDDGIEASQFFAKTYKEIAAREKSGSKTTKVPTDSGAESVNFSDTEIKGDTVDEIWANMQTKLKGKKFSLPSPG